MTVDIATVPSIQRHGHDSMVASTSHRYLETVARLADSPIEAELLLSLRILDPGAFGILIRPGVASIDQLRAYYHTAREKLNRRRLTIAVPQFRLDRYTVDILLVIGCDDFVQCLAIECDGRDYHDLTPAQVDHDRRRDRALSILGIETMRFSGSEIVRDPAQIENEICQWFYSRRDAAAEARQ